MNRSPTEGRPIESVLLGIFPFTADLLIAGVSGDNGTGALISLPCDFPDPNFLPCPAQRELTH